MKTRIKNEKGFTLIEIIAVLVILGILAAVAIPKYLDMRMDSIRNAAQGAVSELNARERLALAQSKLQDASANTYYTVLDYNLGDDWGGTAAWGPVASQSGTADKSTTVTVSFKGKTVVFEKKGSNDINKPAEWSVKSVY